VYTSIAEQHAVAKLKCWVWKPCEKFSEGPFDGGAALDRSIGRTVEHAIVSVLRCYRERIATVKAIAPASYQGCQIFRHENALLAQPYT
jgi:hypothetical protein